VVAARYVRNDRLIDAFMAQAYSALTASPGDRAYYDKQRARGLDHNAALRQLANRLIGILHGCLKTRTHYNETTAWSHHTHRDCAANGVSGPTRACFKIGVFGPTRRAEVRRDGHGE
jgi:hypothetical protein